jgi:hypothetical protein
MKYMMLTILVSGPKQPDDRIDVYLRPLVDDLKILWKPGVLEVWDEYKHEEFTMHDMLFTTINDNLAHRNLSDQSKRKGAACPHYVTYQKFECFPCVNFCKNLKLFA